MYSFWIEGIKTRLFRINIIEAARFISFYLVHRTYVRKCLCVCVSVKRKKKTRKKISIANNSIFINYSVNWYCANNIQIFRIWLETTHFVVVVEWWCCGLKLSEFSWMHHLPLPWPYRRFCRWLHRQYFDASKNMVEPLFGKLHWLHCLKLATCTKQTKCTEITKNYLWKICISITNRIIA